MEACITAIISGVKHRADPQDYRIAPVVLLLALSVLANAVAADTGPVAAAAAAEGPEYHMQLAEQALENRELNTAATEFTLAAELSDDLTLVERATQFTMGVGFDALAERAAGRWIELAPDSQMAHAILGRLRLRRHAVDAAVASFEQALGDAEPRRDEVYLALASDLAAEDDARLVARLLSRLAAQDPLAPGLQLALGTAALRAQNFGLALAAAERAAQDDPGWTEPQLLVARALIAAGRADEGLARASDLLAEDGSPLSELAYTRMLADAGRIDEARVRLDGLVARYGERTEISRTRAFVDLAGGELEAADQRFAAMEGVGQERFEAFYYRALIAVQKGDAELARRYYQRISSGPYLVPAQLAVAETYRRENDLDSALAGLSTFAADHPAQAYEVFRYQAELLQLAGRQAEALAVYDKALEYKPASIDMLLARSALLEQLDRVDAALADLALAVQIAPDDAMALNAYGYLLANRTRQYRKAWTHVRRALELAPDNPPILDSVGWALFKMGRHEEARSWLEQAWALLQDPELASHLVEIYWKLGERERARELLIATLEKWPDSKPAQQTAARLLH
jgi:tetratricopeptide (TPR) repeat protein